MPFIGSEAVAASAVSFLAVAAIAAYLADGVGFPIAPFAILIVAAIGAGLAWIWLKHRAAWEPDADLACGLVVVGVLTWPIWIAWPELLPVGSGPDLTHHLLLIDYIERHWRLVHDVGLSTYLGEMVDYTPGLHLLAVLVGAWTRSDGLHVVYPVVACSVALKAAFVFLITRRLLPRGTARVPLAVIGVLLLFLPRAYFFGSFTAQSYLSQVLSELYALGMWWAIVVWDESPSTRAMMFYALSGAAAFLTWPVWIGPLVIVLAAIALTHVELSRRTRLRHVAIGALPIAAMATMHAARHISGFGIAGTGGFAIRPSADVLGWWFIALSAAGVIVAATERRARTATLLVAAIVVQAAALFATARASGAVAPYLALKMFYLAIYPLAVGGALAIAALWQSAIRTTSARSSLLAWTGVAVLGIAVARPLATTRRQKRVVSQPTYLAGRWAREHLPADCADYLVADAYTAYWLHLAVLGNSRAAGRAMDNDTFEPAKALERWILPEGLPFAITDDFSALPKDIRTSVDVIAQFSPAAVVKRRGPAVSLCR
jgi:hypothetical protein